VRRRLLCRGASAACVLGALVLLGSVIASGSASALAPTATGYWDKLGGPIPNVPAGGLFVANDPTAAANPTSAPPLPVPVPVPSPPALPVPVPTVSGPTAISAVRVTGIAANQDATLSLKVATGWLAPDPSVLTILACPVTSIWSPPAGGAGSVSKAPSYDCSSSSTGRVAGDMSGISWLLPASFQSTPGELDVALVPNPTGLPVASAVGFDRPDASAIHAAIGSNEPPVAAVPPAGPVTTVAPTAFGGGGAPALSYSPAPASSAVTPPATPAASAPVRAPSQSGLILARLPATSRAHRLMAVIALIVLAVGWWWVGGQQVPSPRLLGALATGASAGAAAAGPVAGVGRFSRPRRGEARRL